MNRNHQTSDPPGRVYFSQNRAKQSPDVLEPYVAQYVAWQADGTRIVANAPTWDELEDRLWALGINPNQVVFEYVPED